MEVARPITTRRKSSALPFASVFGLAAITVFIVVSPFLLIMPKFGLDPSWRAVFGEASKLGLRIGSDIILTAGPLSALYTRWFDVDSFLFHLGLNFSLILTVALMIATLGWQHNRYSFAAILSIVILSVTPDTLLISIPALTAFVALQSKHHRNFPLIVAGTSAASVAALAKFSTIPVSMICFILADIVLMSQRRLPFLTATYAAIAFIAFSALVGPTHFFDFIQGSLVISAGYTDAMGIPGSSLELGAYVFITLCVLTCMAWYEATALRRGYTRAFDAAARSLIICGLVFMAFKSGFVRQDMHTLTAWSGIAIAAVIYALVAPRDSNSIKCQLVQASLGVVGLFVFAIPVVLGVHGLPPAQVAKRWIDKVDRSFRLARDFAIDPPGWITAKQREKEAAWARVRDDLPLPLLRGSVDTISSVQSSILAHGLQYKPRYSFQEYATYASRLIERNRHDVAERGPEYLLFDPALMRIDERYPALMEGHLWPDLLTLYAPVSKAGTILVLKRREGQATVDLVGPASTSIVKFGEPLKIKSEEPLFLRVYIEKTLVGKLASFLFRPSIVLMRVTFTDGAEGVFRMIPEIAKFGFVVTPYIATSDDYAALSVGETSDLRKVSRIAFETGRFGALLYNPTIETRVEPIRIDKLRARAKADPETRRYANNNFAFSRLKTSPGVRPIREGLLSHAPNEVALKFDTPASSITVHFGLLDGAWQPPNATDGVCFSLTRTRRGEATRLHTRCLTPVQAHEDRGEQASFVPVDIQPGDVIKLGTSCMQTCDFDWSYWSKLTFE